MLLSHTHTSLHNRLEQTLYVKQCVLFSAVKAAATLLWPFCVTMVSGGTKNPWWKNLNTPSCSPFETHMSYFSFGFFLSSLPNCLGTIVTFQASRPNMWGKNVEQKAGKWNGGPLTRKEKESSWCAGGLVSQTSKRVTKSLCGWSQGVSSVTALICNLQDRKKRTEAWPDTHGRLITGPQMVHFQINQSMPYTLRFFPFHRNTNVNVGVASNYHNARLKDASAVDNVKSNLKDHT